MKRKFISSSDSLFEDCHLLIVFYIQLLTGRSGALVRNEFPFVLVESVALYILHTTLPSLKSTIEESLQFKKCVLFTICYQSMKICSDFLPISYRFGDRQVGISIIKLNSESMSNIDPISFHKQVRIDASTVNKLPIENYKPPAYLDKDLVYEMIQYVSDIEKVLLIQCNLPLSNIINYILPTFLGISKFGKKFLIEVEKTTTQVNTPTIESPIVRQRHNLLINKTPVQNTIHPPPNIQDSISIGIRHLRQVVYCKGDVLNNILDKSTMVSNTQRVIFTLSQMVFKYAKNMNFKLSQTTVNMNAICKVNGIKIEEFDELFNIE